MSHNIVVRRWALAGLAVVTHSVIVPRAHGQQDNFLPASVVNARLDSLESIVRTSSSADRRISAVIRIASVGWIRSEQENHREVRYPGVVARLARIYRQSDDYWTRSSIVELLTSQVERREAVALLEQVAQEPYQDPVAPPGVAVVHDNFSLQEIAISGLTLAGPEGEASLRRLHAGGKVQEPMARVRLERLAQRGFRKDGG